MQNCHSITRRSASNLALAFILLPKAKRADMVALYAFCREVDDIADEASLPTVERARQLAYWREDIQRACSGQTPELPVIGELSPVIKRYQLPFTLFDELLRGVEMDLETLRYETYADLELYCYRVASVVGLLSIEIFGYSDPATSQYAVHLGRALQFTNILRDIRLDAERGRIYLPQTELRRFGVAPEEILNFQYSPRFFELAQSVAQRARYFYREARKALPVRDRKSMVAAELMGSVYWRLLRKLEGRRFQVFGPSLTRLSKLQKLLLIGRTWYRLSAGVVVPNYGTP